MATKINPFHELYLGDSIGADQFVQLFSPVIVEHALPLFQPGHVILKGLPGTGKSMLLNLLKPKVRIGYAAANIPFPVPKELRKFIGAGINLKRSGISDLCQRFVENKNPQVTTPLHFGDFLNYWIVEDILKSITTIKNSASQLNLASEIGIICSEEKLNHFARVLASHDCWEGGLKDIQNLDQLRKAIKDRITAYRSFLNYNVKTLKKELTNTKTTIGIPISTTAELLRKCEIIEKDVQIFIRIDQYEELAWLNDGVTNIGTLCQQMIHRLLGWRESSVSYRIGTRHFAWTDTPKTMFATQARLEEKRTHMEVSIDNVLRRQENPRTYVFPKFAEDIFFRRIKLSNYSYAGVSDNAFTQYVFGKSKNPKERALNYVNNNKAKAIRIEPHWPKKWCSFLSKLAEVDPLNARLAEAWVRQKDKEDYMRTITLPYPWEENKWWRKERIEVALMQIASRNQQQLMYYGEDDLLSLSGGNLLAFLSICQHVWDVWIRDSKIDEEREIALPKFDNVIQSAGIREASADWFEAIHDEHGGMERKAFVKFLGVFFYKSLIEDKAISYPGHNGFSLSQEDIDSNPKISDFLNETSDYGDLYSMPHTSKLNDKKPRRKWYLNPILSPYFKIPYIHTKEPLYASINQLLKWLIDSKAFLPTSFSEVKAVKHIKTGALTKKIINKKKHAKQ
jgi:hypothetical protein